MKIVVLILGMALVTYIPRMMPAVLIDKMKFGYRIEKFLSLIPYTAMAALIFPGVLSVDPNRISIGIIGAITAGLLSWRKAPLTFVVMGAVVVVMLFYAVF